MKKKVSPNRPQRVRMKSRKQVRKKGRIKNEMRLCNFKNDLTISQTFINFNINIEFNSVIL